MSKIISELVTCILSGAAGEGIYDLIFKLRKESILSDQWSESYLFLQESMLIGIAKKNR